MLRHSLITLGVYVHLLATVYAEINDPQHHESLFILASKADLSCMQMKVGVCPTPKPPYVGVYLQYWEPSLFIETVNKPGDYVIREAGVLLNNALSTVAENSVHLFTDNKDFKVTSSSSEQSLTGSSLQFNDIHIYDFPLKMFTETALCPSEGLGSFGLKYMSEVDVLSWRKGGIDLPLTIHVGVWGPLNPRTGYSINFSPLVHSALTSIRAISVASDPTSNHIVTSRLNFGPDLTRDKIQMCFPYKTSCTPLGANLSFWDSYQSQSGQYVWVYWRYRECCRAAT